MELIQSLLGSEKQNFVYMPGLTLTETPECSMFDQRTLAGVAINLRPILFTCVQVNKMDYPSSSPWGGLLS